MGSTDRNIGIQRGPDKTPQAGDDSMLLRTKGPPRARPGGAATRTTSCKMRQTHNDDIDRETKLGPTFVNTSATAIAGGKATRPPIRGGDGPRACARGRNPLKALGQGRTCETAQGRIKREEHPGPGKHPTPSRIRINAGGVQRVFLSPSAYAGRRTHRSGGTNVYWWSASGAWAAPRPRPPPLGPFGFAWASWSPPPLGLGNTDFRWASERTARSRR